MSFTIILKDYMHNFCIVPLVQKELPLFKYHHKVRILFSAVKNHVDSNVKVFKTTKLI